MGVVGAYWLLEHGKDRHEFQLPVFKIFVQCRVFLGGIFIGIESVPGHMNF